MTMYICSVRNVGNVQNRIRFHKNQLLGVTSLNPKTIVQISHVTYLFRFYNCVYGKPHELPCATGLIFDEAQGTCVRPEQGSTYAKKCEVKNEPGKLFDNKFLKLV